MDNNLGLNFEFLTATLSCIGDGIIAAGIESNILYMNTAASQITEWSVEEALGKGFDEVFTLIHADTNEPMQGPIKRALEAQSRVGLKNRSLLLTKEGGRKYVSATCSPIRDSNGVTEGVVVVFRDISLIKQMEEDLRTERNNLKESIVSLENLKSFYLRLFRDFPAIIWKTDIEGKTIYTNKAWTEFTGKTIEECLGFGWIDMLHPQDSEGCFEIHSKAFEAHRPYEMEYRLLQGSGEYHWTKSISRPVYNADGGFDGFMGMALDINEAKKTNEVLERAIEQAESANRAKSEFLANMSHEIRTPLNGIVGMIDLTMLTELSKDQKENLDIAKTCVSSLMKLINDILDFSKMEAGKLILDNVDFNIKKLVDETIKAHSVRVNEKGLELTYSFSSNIPQYIAGDPNRLRQVLNNLMSNAIKFTGSGEIVLGVKRTEISDENIELLFSISDTGIGIPKGDIDRLFVSFSQIDGSITRKFGGTGLGLAISRQLVEMMGGNIWVKSEEGKGSIFYFTIRCKKGSKPAELQAENNMIRKKEKSREILLVEDDTVNQTVVSHMLKKRGNSVDIANNGLEAFKFSENKLHDVILMDIQLPEMDGIEATRHIREREGRGRHTPIIALTAFALQGDREKFLGLGMDEYVPKPVKMEDLFLAIDKVCQGNEGGPVFNEHPRLGENGELVFERETRFKSREDLQPIIDKITDNIKKLSEIIAAGDMSVIEASAHRIKELFSEVDAEEMKGMAFRIELAARRGNLKGVIEGTMRINHEFETYKTSLNSEGGSEC